MSEKKANILGWAGTCMSILMYVAYIAQIMSNLNGNKGSFIQPLAATINCTLWVTYGLCKQKRDYPIIVANIPGIIFGLGAVITSF